VNTPADPNALRRMLYGVIIAVAVAMACGRIASVEFVHEPTLHRDDKNPADTKRKWPATRPQPMPSFSSNDRSRWCTVRSLVDDGTYVIGKREKDHPKAVNGYGDRGIVFEDGWGTVDKILKPDTQEFYSTKPPLLATIVAGEYWLLKHLFGWSIKDEPFLVMRTILFTINGLGWFVYLLLLARLVERYGTTDYGRLFVMAAGAFGTLMTPFLITLNNHTLGTIGMMVVLDQLSSMGLFQRGETERPSWWRYSVVGLACGFTITNETPAAAMAAVVGVWLLWRDPLKGMLAFVPGLLIPLAALLVCNYIAIGEWGLAYAKFGGPWYEYPGSHWVPYKEKTTTVTMDVGPASAEASVTALSDEHKNGIDWARFSESRATYIFHVLLGHHGLFSLTPIFVLSMIGLVRGILATRKEGTTELSYLGMGGMMLTVIVVGFYLFKTDNYGGWTAGPRWLMWLTPIWLLSMLPVVDRIGGRLWGRIVCVVLLAFSVFSVSYPAWNPWRHPWIYNGMDSQGLIPY